MALNFGQNWYVRVSGNDLNGGGFDPTISSPGTNYADSDTPHVTFDGATIYGTTSGASATMTVVGYTVAATDVGNVVRIASGTNFTAGYYAIQSVNTGANTWTFQGNCSTGAGAAMVGRMGGAFTTLQPLSAAGSGSGIFAAPAIASPLVLGNQINVHGSGSDDPSSVDYDWSGGGSGYWNSTSGTNAGRVRIIGYNGRPYIKTSGLLFNGSCNFHHWENLKFTLPASPTYPTLGLTNAALTLDLLNVIYDVAGVDAVCFLTVGSIIDFELRNTGGGLAGTNCGIATGTFAAKVMDGWIHGLRGDGIQANFLPTVHRVLITGCGRDGVRINNDSTILGAPTVTHCTIDANAGNGINLIDADGCAKAVIHNNVITSNGLYGINFGVGTTAVNDNRKTLVDYNFFGSGSGSSGHGGANTSGQINAASNGAHDVTLTGGNPYNNPSGNDWSLNATANAGAAVRAAGFPTKYRGSSTNNYVDGGAAQHQDSGGGGGLPQFIKTGNIGTY